MFNFSFWDIVLILMLGLIIFGPDKLPNIAKSMGKGLYEFRKITSQATEKFEKETQELKEKASLIEKEDDNKTSGNGGQEHETQKQISKEQ